MDFIYKKSLGQNFLKDGEILLKIKNAINIEKDDLIIEIGPGHGALTKYLVSLNCDVCAFEIDERVKPYLDKITNSNLKIVYKDFLNVDIRSEINLEKYNRIHIVANIPYYITTPIIEKIIDESINETDMVLMVQKEVADRFCAKPGNNNYGSITVMLNLFYNVSKLFDVGRKSFIPVPNVDSSVIKFEKKDCEYDFNKKDFLRFVHNCFQYKRKNIKNNLSNYDLEKILQVLVNYNHNLQSRAEEFTLNEFIDLYNNITS